jgi:hypothetical protein
MLVKKIKNLNLTLDKIVENYDFVLSTLNICPKSDEQYSKPSLATQMLSLDMSIQNAKRELIT